MMWLWLASAGALGAIARIAADEFLARRVTSNRAVTIALINVTGAFAAGLVASFTVHGGLTADAAIVLSAGFLGAFTTFSTAILHVVERLAIGEIARAVVRAIVPLAAVTCAAGLGFAAGVLIVR